MRVLNIVKSGLRVLNIVWIERLKILCDEFS